MVKLKHLILLVIAPLFIFSCIFTFFINPGFIYALPVFAISLLIFGITCKIIISDMDEEEIGFNVRKLFSLKYRGKRKKGKNRMKIISILFDLTRTKFISTETHIINS